MCIRGIKLSSINYVCDLALLIDISYWKEVCNTLLKCDVTAEIHLTSVLPCDHFNLNMLL